MFYNAIYVLVQAIVSQLDQVYFAISRSDKYTLEILTAGHKYVI